MAGTARPTISRATLAEEILMSQFGIYPDRNYYYCEQPII